VPSLSPCTIVYLSPTRLVITCMPSSAGRLGFRCFWRASRARRCPLGGNRRHKARASQGRYSDLASCEPFISSESERRPRSCQNRKYHPRARAVPVRGAKWHPIVSKVHKAPIFSDTAAHWRKNKIGGNPANRRPAIADVSIAV